MTILHLFNIPSFAYVPAGFIIIYHFGIITDRRCIIRYIFSNYTPCTDSDIVPYFYIFNDTNIRSDICIITYDCRLAVIAANGSEL